MLLVLLMLVCTIVRGFKPYYAPKNFRFQVLRSLASEKGQSTAKVEAGASTSSGWPVSRVRTQFVDYFKDAHEHTNVISSPVVPVNDPTLLFANAGMNQFKSIFTGTVDPTSPLANLKSAVNSQKCIRAGGKHNDLDDVGKDTYHHTFFEMLGTWSFGDYFKEQAIDMAWDLLVNVYGLPKERLYASYFQGDEAAGVPADEEAKALWGKYLPEDRILPFDKADNFWEMGDTGPCGPCTEIHFDRIGGRYAADLVNMDDPDVIEIWNLVFIQFNREPSGELRSLPDKHVDTGMGLERITSILQNKRSNYDTDAFTGLFQAIQEVTGAGPYTGLLGEEDAAQDYKDMAYRVVADHIRTIGFAIADGAVPSNEGRGYVLRRVLRRAIRYGQTLGAKPGFFAKLVPVLVEEYGDAFPELRTKQTDIVEVIVEEEKSFSTMLDRGVKYFNDLTADINKEKKRTVSGERAFYMYDTLGFPVDLTQLMAEEKGLAVDMEGFAEEMRRQKDRSRLATQAKRLAGRTALTLGAEQTAYLADSGVLATEDSHKYVWDTPVSTTVKAVFTSEGFVSEKAVVDGEETFALVLEASPFYPEAGGQINDLGQITVDGVLLDVIDVQSYGGFALHTCVLSEEAKEGGEVKVGGAAIAAVDYDHRRKVAPNHTMTHVLNYALRKVVSEEVDQKGSSVTEEKLRFDFNAKKALTAQQLLDVEEMMNEIIEKELEVNNKMVPLDDARAINGLRAVFGETYPDPVRVVSVGPSVDSLLATPDSADWLKSSIEFCGGTHLSNTREALACCLVEEAAVAKGIRRISAVTGELAKTALHEGQLFATQLASVKSAIKDKSVNLAKIDAETVDFRVRLDTAIISAGAKSQMRGEVETVQKEIIALKNQAMMAAFGENIKPTLEDVTALQAAGVETAVLSLGVGTDSKAIKKAIDAIQKISPNLSFAGIAEDSDKLAVFAVVSDAGKEKGLDAGAWVKATVGPYGGRGGGKPNMAQGSIPDSSKRAEAVAEAQKYLP